MCLWGYNYLAIRDTEEKGSKEISQLIKAVEKCQIHYKKLIEISANQDQTVNNFLTVQNFTTKKW